MTDKNNHYDYVRPVEHDVLPPSALNDDGIEVERKVRPSKKRNVKRTERKSSRPKLHGWLMTYQKTVDIDELPPADTIKHVLEKNGAEKYSFQLEQGKETGLLHYQIHVVFQKGKTDSEVLQAFYNNGRLKKSKRQPIRYYKGGCLTVQPATDCSASWLYCMKSDTRVQGPWYYPNTVYFGKDLIGSEKYPTALPWQAQLDEIISKPPDERHIYLIVDEEGNKGKTKYTKTKGSHDEAVVIDAGLSATQMKNAFIGLGPKPVYIIDLPRSSKEFPMVLNCAETLKNGVVTSFFQGKFRQIYMDIPHVICFSNRYPDLELLSLDRWQVFNICPKNLDLVPKDLYPIKMNQRNEIRQKWIDSQENLTVLRKISKLLDKVQVITKGD